MDDLVGSCGDGPRRSSGMPMDVVDEDVEAGAGSSSSSDDVIGIGDRFDDMKNKRSFFEQRMSSAFNDKKETVYQQCNTEVNFVI